MTLSNIYLSLILYATIFTIHCVELGEVKVFKRGKIQLVDETQFNEVKNSVVDYDDYDTDPKHQPSFGDIYDELIAYLPRFEAFKNGKNIGFTRVPIVTRRQPTWSTPLPRTRKGDYKTWSTPRLEPVTRPSAVRVTSAALRVIKEKTSSRESKESHSSTFSTPTTPSTTVKVRTTSKSVALLRSTVTSTSQSTTTTRRIPQRLLVTSTPKVIDGVKPNKKEAQSRNHQVGRNREQAHRKVSTTTTTTSTPSTKASTKIFTTRLIPRRRFMHNREQTVKSNNFTVEALSTTAKKTATIVSKTFPQRGQQQERSGGGRLSTTSSPLPRRVTLFSWSRFWSLSPDGVLTVHNWDSRQGSRTETKVLFSTTATPTKRKHVSNATTIIPQKNTNIKTSNPLHISVGKSTNREARTHDCRVLNAATDGRPGPLNDESCRLSSPGFSADESCKCTYEPSGRDSTGCVVGFVYTCIHVQGATNSNR